MKHSINPAHQVLTTQVLVVGGGVGGTAAAIQSARRGAQTMLISEGEWLGGMLTAAGVCAPDGNELSTFQTGIWGAFLRALQAREPQGLDHGWVSFFTYQPATGAQIFADWVNALPNLTWYTGLTPQDVLRAGHQITGVEFESLTVLADIVIDGTELGDLLELGAISYRLGWEFQSQWQEPSAPHSQNLLTQTYPVQAPTWVFYLREGESRHSKTIAPISSQAKQTLFAKAWSQHGPEKFMTYGGIPGHQYMINWPIHGNDYGEGVGRLFGSMPEKQSFLEEAIAHSQAFADHIIQAIDKPYELADDVFPNGSGLGGGAFALHPYYRESRRLIGIDTVIEQDLLPIQAGAVASLPRNTMGQVSAIAIGNYANDHHYPSGDIPLAPKSMIWGGRWTGTAFTMPYGCLVPETIDGFLVCEKNQSVSHMANGATRLQPVVLGCGQAAGMAAAMCVEQGIQPRELDVRSLQEALLTDPEAPAAVIPFYNLPPYHPDWQAKQLEILEHPGRYPRDGNYAELKAYSIPLIFAEEKRLEDFQGVLHRHDEGQYELTLASGESWKLVTLHDSIHQSLAHATIAGTDLNAQASIRGWPNRAGRWIRVYQIAKFSS